MRKGRSEGGRLCGELRTLLDLPAVVPRTRDQRLPPSRLARLILTTYHSLHTHNQAISLSWVRSNSTIPSPSNLRYERPKCLDSSFKGSHCHRAVSVMSQRRQGPWRMAHWPISISKRDVARRTVQHSSALLPPHHLSHTYSSNAQCRRASIVMKCCPLR